MSKYADQLKSISLAKKKLEAKELRTIQKAMTSDSPTDLIAVDKIINKNITKAENKSFLIDPLEFNSNLRYKDKAFSLSYSTLNRMSKAPVINSIIKTRKNQIADFAEPQENKYSNGFVIRKKTKFGEEQKMSNRDRKIAFSLTEFLLRGGNAGSWRSDDFDIFIRKLVNDSLIFDQCTFECVRNRRGVLEFYTATDASTFRMADSFFDEGYRNNAFFKNRIDSENYKRIQGYPPYYVQIYQNSVVNEFYPWELCFGVRNPSTSIYSNGYGISELEELINVVTSMLWGDEYNRKFFSQGSAPKGMLKVKGSPTESALQQFKQQWQSMISGVMQSWKTPVVEADVEWIDLQKNNRDMEYTSWMEYLVKLSCSVYSIDPTEIGWDISRSGGGGLFEGSQEQRMKHSKDKGLYPLLKFIQRKINKYIIEPLNPDFEFAFMGLNGLSIDEELKMDIDKVNSFMTVNEIREKYELKPLDGGDKPNNSYFQNNEEEQNNYNEEYDEEEDEDEDDNQEKANNFSSAFVKSFDSYLNEINKNNGN